MPGYSKCACNYGKHCRHINDIKIRQVYALPVPEEEELSAAEDDAPLLAIEHKAPILAIEDNAPLLAIEDDAPLLAAEGPAPQRAIEDEAPLLAAEGPAPQHAIEDEAPLLAAEGPAPLLAAEGPAPRNVKRIMETPAAIPAAIPAAGPPRPEPAQYPYKRIRITNNNELHAVLYTQELHIKTFERIAVAQLDHMYQLSKAAGLRTVLAMDAD